ncbi:MAG: hypothetical protein V1835_05300 [Candidatus Micrarchaeota archaeon]
MFRGFIFSLEAAITLMLAALLVFSLPYFRLSTYSDVYLQELTCDLQQIAYKQYYSDFAAFSKGDLIAKRHLETEFSRIIHSLGDYCLQIEARSNELDLNCRPANPYYRKKFSTSRLWYDGTEYFELRMILKV